VKFSLEQVNRKYNPQGITGLSMLKSVDAPDDYTVVLHLSYAFPAFFPWSLVNQWILPKHLYDNGTNPTTNPVNAKPIGTGPYLFREWVRGNYILLQRNPNYFKAGKPYPDRLVFKVIPDASARVAALETGDVDHLNFISMPTTAVKRLRSSPNVTVKLDRSRANYGIIIAQINVRNAPLKVKEVRQAIAYAIDQKEIITKALDGIGEMSTGPISPQQTQWYNANVRKYEHNPKLANEMLDKAGFPRGANGTRFPLRIAYDRNAEGGALQSAAEIMREDMRAVGIELQLKPLDGPSWMEQTAGKWDYDISVGSFQTGPDPAVAVSRLYITKNIGHRLGTNTMGYSNPKVDELFATSEREIDDTKRKAELDEVQALLVEELPSIWLWAKVAPIAYRKYVHGDLPAGTTHNENFDSIWLSDKK
jgi:peptide/nickel transport system substrate-binding protein